MWLWALLLSLPLSLAVSGPLGPEGDGELHCGPQGLRFTVQPPSLGTGAPPALIVWGKCADPPAAPSNGSPPATPRSVLANTAPVADAAASL